jgi:hypothetical protein
LQEIFDQRLHRMKRRAAALPARARGTRRTLSGARAGPEHRPHRRAFMERGSAARFNRFRVRKKNARLP